jgi:predicted DsbA family dithiol-disulfide isomerase
MECPRVVADVVEIQEFPYLAQAYGVRGVPMTVINDTVQFSGMVTEEVFLGRLLEAIGEQAPEEDTQDVDAHTTDLS